jgi:hypothetical protein
MEGVSWAAMVAQALIEKGMLDTLSMEAGMLWDRLRMSVQDGSVVWVLLAVAFLILFMVSRKR